MLTQRVSHVNVLVLAGLAVAATGFLAQFLLIPRFMPYITFSCPLGGPCAVATPNMFSLLGFFAGMGGAVLAVAGVFGWRLFYSPIFSAGFTLTLLGLLIITIKYMIAYSCSMAGLDLCFFDIGPVESYFLLFGWILISMEAVLRSLRGRLLSRTTRLKKQRIIVGSFLWAVLILSGVYILVFHSPYVNGGCITDTQTGLVVCAPRALDYPAIVIGVVLLIASVFALAWTYGKKVLLVLPHEIGKDNRHESFL